MKKFLFTSLLAVLVCSSQSCSNGNVELEEARIEQANKLEEAARVAKEEEKLAEKDRLEDVKMEDEKHQIEQTERKSISSETRQRAERWAARTEMRVRASQDKNSYAKMNMYSVGGQ